MLYLADLMLEYLWLFPIASVAIYGLFAWRGKATGRSALVFSVSIPGSTLLPVQLIEQVNACCGSAIYIISLIFPAIWILALVSLWQGVNLLRDQRRKIGPASIIAAIGLAALYPFTSFINHGLNSIRSP